MLRIQHKQIDAFKKSMLDQFFGRVVAYIRRTNPQYVEEHGESATSELVERGYEMSQDLALITERDIVRLVDLMVKLGPDFADNPEYPWAKEILESDQLLPVDRLDELCKAAEDIDPDYSTQL